MDEKLCDMQEEGTDEEGFPRQAIVTPGPSTNPFRLRRRFRINPILQNQENGETTGQQVVVMRRPQWSPLESSPEATLPAPVRRRISMHFNLIALRRTMPDFKYTHPTCPKGKCAATPMEYGKDKRGLFRIPFECPSESQRKQAANGQKEKVIYVSIWKEYFHADNIFELTPMDMEAVRKKRCSECLSTKLTDMLKEYIPVFYIKAIFLLCLIMKCVVCKITVPFAMYYRSHKHMKIHRSCDERGVRPVFTGSACHGPIIYGIRKFGCQFCRAQKQSDVSLKLLGIMNQERRTQQAT